MAICNGLTTAALKRLGDCAALATLNLAQCERFTALAERLGDCGALTTLTLWSCSGLTALPEWIGDCAAHTTLDLRWCTGLPNHLDVGERLKARGCEVRK